jgi:hypothetical protein
MIEEDPAGYSIEEEEGVILRFSCLLRLRYRGAGDIIPGYIRDLINSSRGEGQNEILVIALW